MKCSAKAILIAVLIVGAALSAAADPVRIRVVDGRNGKVVKNERVQVWVGESRGAMSLSPRPDGSAEFDAPRGTSIRIATNLYVDCRPFKKGTPRPLYSVDEILEQGVVTANTCGGSSPAKKPGEVVFQVRPLRFLEGLRR